MEKTKMQTETMRLVYETPSVELTYWETDILMASTDVGEEYPDDWN